MSEDYRLFTLEQAAKELRVRWEHVRELVETGQLRAVKIGSRYRVPASALKELGVSAGAADVAGRPTAGLRALHPPAQSRDARRDRGR